MAARSPSPNPSRPSKTPESGSLLRRSTNSLTAKPSNPQDILQRNSSSKPVTVASLMRSSFEHKENESDPGGPRPVRARSPAMASKGAKNFMSPTISASSKVIAASPRRKILGERNEGAEMEEFGVKSSTEMGFSSQEVLVKREPRKMDSDIRNGQSPGVALFSPPVIAPLDAVRNGQSPGVALFSPPVIAPLDADPSLPPYDPKTNYLSPRPRFLHYKPNPRIEQYLHKEEQRDSFEVGDGKRLEDTFSSENCEDTFGDTDESEDTFGDGKQQLENSYPTFLQKSSEENSSSSSEVEAEDIKDETHASEPDTKTEPSGKNAKPRSFLRSKIAPLLLVMLIACISLPLSDSPMISSSSSMLIKNHSIPNLLRAFEEHRIGNYLNEVAVVARANLIGMFNRFQLWSVNSIPYAITEPEVFLLHLANFTSTAVDEPIEFLSGVIEHNEFERSLESEREIAIEDNLHGEREDSCSAVPEEVNVSECEEGYNAVAEEIAMEHKHGVAVESVGNEVKNSQDEDVVFVEEIISSSLDKMEHEVVEEEGRIEEKQDIVENFEDVVGKEGSVIEEKQKDVENFVEVAGEKRKDLSVSEHEEKENAVNIHFESGEDDQTSSDLKPLESVDYVPKNEFLKQATLGVCSLAIVFVTMVFLHRKLMQSPAVAREKLTAKKVKSLSGSNERPFGVHNFSMDVEMMGDSSTSEISSSLHTTLSYGRQRPKKAKDEEKLSNEKKSRRDSIASTSISYGSFTTYERLSAKKAGRDESEVTPVRRSSRIRQLTSPSGE